MKATQTLIEQVIRFFLPLCAEQRTLLELQAMAAEPKQWRYAHALFRRIRDKSLRAIETHDSLSERQYAFEEICAKTLFNLSEHYDPQCLEFPERFDDDSAFWFFPTAIGFAEALNIPDFVARTLHLGKSL